MKILLKIRFVLKPKNDITEELTEIIKTHEKDIKEYEV